MISLLVTSIEQGLIFSILALGVFLTYKVLNLSDLSVEGTFPLGAFIFARFISMGRDPITATIMAFCFGSLAGLMTTALFIKLKIKPLLAGILTMTMLYSINLRINGKGNIPLFSYNSIFDLGPSLLVLVVIVLTIKILLDIFLKTEVGYLLIATGDNESLVRALGQSSNKYKLIGFMIANGLVALSGALMSQYQGFADITMGASTIVIGLASIIIGETVRKNSNLLKKTSRVIFGSVVYKVIGGLAIKAGLAPTDLRAVTAIIVIAFIAYNNLATDKIQIRKKRKGDVKYVKNTEPIKEF